MSEKIQIVAFSTNETEQNPNDIINTFLEQQNHIILKKTRNAIAFSTQLNNSQKNTKIMICSVLNLGREYTGITDVNCYIIFIDLEKETSKEKFESIISYAKDYCDLTKKIFIFGMINVNTNKDEENTPNEKCINKDDITKILENTDIIYEYKELDLSNIKDIYDVIINILVYSSKHSISSDIIEETEKDQSGSCNIF